MIMILIDQQHQQQHNTNVHTRDRTPNAAYNRDVFEEPYVNTNIIK